MGRTETRVGGKAPSSLSRRNNRSTKCGYTDVTKTSLVKNARAIDSFLRADKYVQASMLSNASKSFIQTWVDLITDILKGKVTITRNQYNHLQGCDRDIDQFRSKKTPLHIKRHLLSQKGGFLPILAGIIKPLLGSLVGSLFR